MNLPFKSAALPAAIALVLGTMNGRAQAQSSPTEEAAGQLETVVVTAQKRRDRLLDVPISVTVIGEQALEKGRVQSLMDLAQSVPNFEAAPLPGTPAVTVRGVGGGGRNIGFDTRVGVYVDGIYMGQAQALGQPLFDIEQVEVLRGPQGHLFGRNTVAGAVNITTRAPSDVLEGSVRAVVGNLGAREVYGTVSGPLAEKLTAKLSLASELRDGYTTNLFNGQKLDDLRRQTARGRVVFKPTEGLSFDLAADHSDSRQSTIVGEPTTSFSDQPLTGGPLPHRVVNFNTSPTLENQLSGVSLTSSLALAGGNTLTAVTGYRRTQQVRTNDTDYSPLDILKIRYEDGFKQFSQELRVASAASGGVRYVVGVYGLSESAETLRTASSGPAAALLRLPTTLAGLNQGTVETHSLAAFGSLDIDLPLSLALNLGARYTHEKKNLVYNLSGGAALGLATVSDLRDSQTEKRLTPTVGLSFAVDRDMTLFGKYSSGFKSGGWNADFVTTTQLNDGLAFKPETVKSFELGMKAVALNGRLQYELAVFNSQYDNYQTFFFIPAPNGRATLQLKNAARVDSRGLEASARWRITSALRVGAGLGLLNTTYTSFPNGGGLGVDLSGQRVPDTPRLSTSLNMDYTLLVPALGGSINLYADYSHRDATVQGNNLPNLGARDLVNARLSFQANSGRWQASLWGRNLSNQDYVLGSGRDVLGNNFVKRGMPRTFGAEFKLFF